MEKLSYVSNADVSAIDELYKSYKQNPESVDYSWQKFFEGFEFSLDGSDVTPGTPVAGDMLHKEIQVRNLIYQYRRRGHLVAKTNPIRERKDRRAGLELESFGLSQADMNTVFVAGEEIGLKNATLKEIIERLDKIYRGALGFEYMYIREPKIWEYLMHKVEKEAISYKPSQTSFARILGKLNEAVVFENFLHTKFIGQKRFSLEGGENLIPALDRIICVAGNLGCEEVIIGMAHRGRLNVLSNIMGKTYEQIFTEFEGNVALDQTMGDGDVKYHMGYSSQYKTDKDKLLNLTLSPNPSHLEAVDPLVLGYTRAQIDDEYKGNLNKAIPILIHGDAAIAGQGILYEIAQMSNLEGYNVGGTIHFVINNQIGFTTDFEDARSSIYCTDVAKVIDAPVIHVNGDNPEAVIFAATLATEFRQKFNRDIFIDMVCYRRHGHNESDEPKFTQPKLYNVIAKHPNPRDIYNKFLLERGDIDAQMLDNLDREFRDLLQSKLNMVKEKPLPYQPQKYEIEWDTLQYSKPGDFDKSPDTPISLEVYNKIGEALTRLPEGFKPLKQISNLLKDRKKMFFEDKVLNWASAELLAYGSLLLEGNIVRMSGQDVKRGTFSHRHAVLFDSETNEPYNSLNHIEPEQKQNFKIFNSLLSEFGVLGFEYGYAQATPHALVIWEAQFGDFANGAQVMIDQFISSAETKWQRMNGLVMLLPHGYEGQGPEHSNARPERFLQLCADDNMVVANLTTPANLFHLMRRQLAWNFRKPCVIMSPKSMLRNPACASPISEFTAGGFKEVYDDATIKDAAKVKKMLFCTGKVYYDLLAEQQEKGRQDVAIIRLEQLAPFPEKQVDAIVAKYKNAEFLWVQEEPENMGYWAYLLRVYRKVKKDVIARKASASPATGYNKRHNIEQKELVAKAFE